VKERIDLVVVSTGDIVAARHRGRCLAEQLGFTASASTLIVYAISELARNMMLYADRGALRLGRIHQQGRLGLVVVALDRGPGIADVRRALLGGYSTSGGLGLGLSGVALIMDEFTIRSDAGRGTRITAKKWLPAARHLPAAGAGRSSRRPRAPSAQTAAVVRHAG
jgi:serine/threonine-protein kinase RsbT